MSQTNSVDSSAAILSAFVAGSLLLFLGRGLGPALLLIGASIYALCLFAGYGSRRRW